ncbi:MAG: divalent-cation tolerance protein CutA [Nitrospina sp.]|jgi:periplasmic divalent cation tolerance protein|nr:divalent-cation tolerance protein CutA [Nitrospina sp.]MBT6717427.1 divalent-cation tolerance protein CutA [Nitrospina sp.]
MDEHCVIFITAGSKEEAEKLSRGMVEKRLAFCVNTVPGIQSTYFWEGKVHVDDEILLIAKTRQQKYGALENWVKQNHSYDVPEIISLPIQKGLPEYLNAIDDWVTG